MFIKNLFSGEVTVTNRTLAPHLQRKLEIEGLAEELLGRGQVEMPLGLLTGEWALVKWMGGENRFFYSLYHDHKAPPPDIFREEVCLGAPNSDILMFRLWEGNRLVGMRYSYLRYPGYWSAAGRGQGHLLTTIGLEVMTLVQVWVNGHFHIKESLSRGATLRWEKEGLLKAETSADLLRAFGWPEEDCVSEEEE